MSLAVRSSRFPYMCRALLRFPHLSFIPPVPYSPLRGTFPSRGRLCIGDSGTLANGALVTIFPDLFHPASPIQPPPLRGTSFHRKEGVSTRAPSLGRGCRAQRGGVGFLLGRRSPLLFAFPIWERGPRAALGYSRKRRTCDDLLRSFSSRQNPIRLAPLATFPTRGRLCPSLFFFPHMRVFALTMREKRHSRIVAFPIGEGGPRSGGYGALVNDALVTIFPALFHTASPLSGSLRSPPSPRGEGFTGGIVFPHMHVFALTICG